MRTAVAPFIALIVSTTLLAAPSAEASKGAQHGVLTIQKSISLTFPQPGEYRGRVELLGAKKVVKNAENRFGKKAGRKIRRVAKRRALAFCKSSLAKTPVRVEHLSKPPFLIGTAKPAKMGLFYRVFGPQPPVGDPVRASQRTAIRGLTVGGFKWEARCRRAQVVKPYG